MKKAEAEGAIKRLCLDWSKEVGIAHRPDSTPSFAEFRAWLKDKGHSQYLTFRSRQGAQAEAELWFDEVFRLTWQR